MKSHRLVAVLALAGLLAPAGASAQWVSFTDQTANRLRIRPLVDGTPNQIRDSDEKDIAVNDLNQDGWDDVIVVRKRRFSNPGARQDILLMNRNGRLVDATPVFAPGFLSDLTDARDVFVADFTGDGWDDVVIANTFGEQPKFYRNAGNDGDGRWQGLVDESTLRLPFIDVPGDVNTLQICAVWGGDVTGNGALDIYLSNYKEIGGTRDLLLINNGGGFFTNETDERLGPLADVAFGTSAEIHDMDGDGDQDIVKISALYEEPPFDVGTFVLFNDGTGNFDNLPFQELDASSPYMFTVGDFDGDNQPDVYLQGDNQDRVSIADVVRPNGPNDYMTYTLSPSPRTSGLGGNTKVADVDGDGDLDVGVAPIDVDIGNCGMFFNPEFSLLENNGNGFVTDPWSSGDDQNIHTDAFDFAFLDLNRDGCTDLFMGLCEGWKVFIQDCS